MIDSKKALYEYLSADYYALYPSGAGLLQRLKNPIYSYVKHLRYCEYYLNMAKGLAYFNPRYVWHKWIVHHLGIKLGFSISENCFGPGLSIAHYGTIIVNPNARIGSNCRIHPGVCIGANKDVNDVPTVGDNVYIGPGAKLFGNISIGDNCRIGANAVVLRDADAGSILVGIPAKPIIE